MSLLIPANLSNAYKGNRKPDKSDIMFSRGCSATIKRGDISGAELLDSGDKPKTEVGVEVDVEVEVEVKDCVAKANRPLQKRVPVPVALVDPDPVQMMEPDEYGAELGKEARVWKVYVQETDTWDRELVDGWNKSLDVILVFAALFSTVSTAFLVESSEMLQQNPDDTSAATLLTISHILLAMANNSSIDLTNPAMSNFGTTPSFVPSCHAVIINTLWYLSLSLSIATLLLAMLAKDWCHSFTANRTGHPWDQALRRQRKWTMIKRWKMQELITVLPALIHLSLLLFAIGLSIYVWDMNTTAAVPVACVSGASLAFYLWSSSMASMIKLFPYTTIISRILQSDFMRHQYRRMNKYAKLWAIRILTWALVVISRLVFVMLCMLAGCLGVLCLPLLFVEVLCFAISSGWSLSGFDWTQTYWFICIFNILFFIVEDLGGEALSDAIGTSLGHAERYLESTRMRMAKDNQDEMISLALQWLIQNCETPSSVAIALQSIAGASSRIPTEPLKSCQATLQIFQRLVSSPNGQKTADTELYTRALAFLESSIKPANNLNQEQNIQRTQHTNAETKTSQRPEGIEVIMWDLKSEHERQVVDLINSTQILPTKENIDALSVGSSATSLGLRLLEGDVQIASEVFDSVMEKLCIANSVPCKLDPAAVQSLANTAVALTLCSTSSLFSPNMLQQCIEHCLLLSTLPRRHSNPLPKSQTTNIMVPETVLLMCVLLQRRISPESSASQIPVDICARAQWTVDLLKGSYMKDTLSQSMFHRVGSLTVLSNPAKFGTTREAVFSMHMGICRNYLGSGFLLSLGTQEGLCDHPESMVDNSEILEFLLAVDKVSELSAMGALQGCLPMSLPAPIYCVLVLLSCVLRTDDQQTQCQRLLSQSGFPKLDQYFLAALRELVSRKNFLRVLWDIYESSKTGMANRNRPPRFAVVQRWRAQDAGAVFKARSRHFAATQFWLLLHLIANSSTSLQEQLKETVNRDTELGTDNWEIDPVREELEEEIIQGYEQGHQFGVYSARIIECILESRDRSYKLNTKLSKRIAEDLKGVPDSIRLLRSFSDLSDNLQSNSTSEDIQPSSSSLRNPVIPDKHSVNQLNQQLSARMVESDSSLVSSFTRALNTKLPPSTPSIPIAEGSKLNSRCTDFNDTEQEGIASHVVIPILSATADPGNA